MSWFKTKKLTHTQVKKEIQNTENPKKKYRIIRWIFIVLICLSSSVFAVIFLMNINKDNSKFGSENFQPIIQSDFLSLKKAWTINVLIAGIGWQGHDWSDLTDSIILASLNGDDKKVTLLSIPRDLYVSYPEGKWAGRINNLYGLWKANAVGVKYLADKVTEITGQPIDHYVIIDFTGFKKIIDVLGGIEIDVPADLIDREYPNDNWWYETLSIKKWLQIMNGDTALKYSRSRHSTSDFDRSNRQQLVIKAIKKNLFSADTAMSPTKISTIFSTVMDHLDTDMSLATMADTIFSYRSISEDAIKIHTLNNECISLRQCMTWAYLYSPSRDLFDGASVIIPENARVNKLSYYWDIRRFVDMIFRFPDIATSQDEIILVSTKNNLKITQSIALSLSKLGIKISNRHPIITATWSVGLSHINIYWHPDLSIGINPDWVSVQALKYLEESIPYSIVTHNEYVSNDGPKIEIVIGDDIAHYFSFVTPIYYIPTTPTKTNVSGEESLWSGSSKWKKSIKKEVPLTKKSIQWSISPETITSAVVPASSIPRVGEWEDFGG